MELGRLAGQVKPRNSSLPLIAKNLVARGAILADDLKRGIGRGGVKAEAQRLGGALGVGEVGAIVVGAAGGVVGVGEVFFPADKFPLAGPRSPGSRLPC